MNRAQAKKIAYSGEVRAGQIMDMLRCAYDNEYPDETASKGNPSFSRGHAFNVSLRYYRTLDPLKKLTCKGDMLGAYNAIREFGDFGPAEWQAPPKKKKPRPEPRHEMAISPYEAWGDDEIPF